MVITEKKADLPTPENTEPHPTPVEAENDEGRSKRVRNPSQRVVDLLEGPGTWSDKSTNSLVPPGIQLMAEEGANDDNLTDWLYNVPAHVEGYAFAAVIGDSEALEPQSLAEAKRGGDWPLWEKAIHEELATLEAAGTWELTERPEGANVIGSKWVFKAKRDAAGKIVRYKARLVAQGFSQIPGINYFNMFVLVARLASIRTVLTFAASEDLETGQIDIKGAYLNGERTNLHVPTSRIRPRIPSLQTSQNPVWSQAV
jgi:hypothetical protein